MQISYFISLSYYAEHKGRFHKYCIVFMDTLFATLYMQTIIGIVWDFSKNLSSIGTSLLNICTGTETVYSLYHCFIMIFKTVTYHYTWYTFGFSIRYNATALHVN